MTLDQLYDHALSLYGVPYEWGGIGPRRFGGYGYDCSGYVEGLLAKAGIFFGARYNAHDLYLHFNTEKAILARGALAFFGKPERVSHVGWMIDEKCMISAAGGGPSCVNQTTAIRNGAYVKIQPIAWYKAPPFVGAYMPAYPVNPLQAAVVDEKKEPFIF